MSAPGWIAATGLGSGVLAGMSTRLGGVSAPPFDAFNLRPSGLPGAPADAPASVAENHRRLAQHLGAWPVWLEQVHGADCVRLDVPATPDGETFAPVRQADASITTVPGVVCTVLVADCLPVLFSAGGDRPVAVGAAHAGWRGLAAGVLERTVEALCDAAGCGPRAVRAWMGACIGPEAFEVGAEVLEAFGVEPPSDGFGERPDASGNLDPALPARRQAAFRHAPRPDGSPRWQADLGALARERLRALGLDDASITGPLACTVTDRSRFFSYRRDGLTGRMAACIRLTDHAAR